MDQPLYDLFSTAQLPKDWYAIEDSLKSYERDQITKTDLHFILRRCFPQNHETSNVHYRIIRTMIETNSSIVDRNLMLSLFRADFSAPSAIISLLFELYSDSSSIDLHVKSDQNWKGKFLCDACFGYCPVDVNRIKIFIEKHPECLSYCTNDSQKLFPIHKACQSKFRRRAKQERLRDNKSLFQLLLRETIRTEVFKQPDSSIGGLFRSDENNVDGLGFLVKKVGENEARYWVLQGLINFHDLPILQVIIKHKNCIEYTCWIEDAIKILGKNVCKVRDDRGKIPLEVALSFSIPWDCGLSAIIEAHPSAFEQHLNDKGFTTLAFIFDLSTLFNVIKYHPTILKRLRQERY